MISVIITTCCLEKLGTGYSGRSHSHRAEWLRKMILPRCIRDPLVDEVIVVGAFEQGTGYDYYESPSQYHDCRDMLAQRDLGSRVARGRWLFFLADDHLPTLGLLQIINKLGDTHVLSPLRVDFGKTDRTGLNSGRNETQCKGTPIEYWHTHAIGISATLLNKCPWRSIPPISRFDIVHSLWLQESGGRRITPPHEYVVDLGESAWLPISLRHSLGLSEAACAELLLGDRQPADICREIAETANEA